MVWIHRPTCFLYVFGSSYYRNAEPAHYTIYYDKWKGNCIGIVVLTDFTLCKGWKTI